MSCALKQRHPRTRYIELEFDDLAKLTVPLNGAWKHIGYLETLSVLCNKNGRIFMGVGMELLWGIGFKY